MSRSDLASDIHAEYDAALLGWGIWVPLSYIESVAAREGRMLTGPPPSHERLCQAGQAMAREIAEVLAAPGPIQRSVRKQIAANNRRRFGP